jgi:glycosidase
VYYGEEIGMTGAKRSGDERLRTPMHWRRAAAAGFTSGPLPWEPLAPDSFTANVEVLDGDPASLLNLHRNLIHLRTANPALSSGEFVPLTTSSPGALAYLRRTASDAVLVLANLTDQPLSDVAISGANGALPAGRYSTRALVGDAPATAVRIGGNGRISGWAPVRSLAPLATHVIQLSR